MRKRPPYEAAILAALMLGSCSSNWHSPSEAYDLADVAQANARTALAQNEQQSRKAQEIEDQIRRVERAVEDVQTQVNNNARAYNSHLDDYRRHTH